jgi:hypothetical protein
MIPGRHHSAALLLATVLLVTPAALSAKTTLQARLALSGAWTDNALNAGTNPQSDFFFNIDPALVLTSGVPRAVQQLIYDFDAALFATHSEANAYSHRLTWNGFFLTSKTTDLMLGAQVGQSRTNTFSLQNTSETTTVVTQPGQPTYFLNGNLREVFGWDISPSWRFLQSAAFTFYTPLQPRTIPDTLSLDQMLEIQRYFRRQALALEVRNLLTDYSQVNGPDAGPGGGDIGMGGVPREQLVILTSAVAKWRADWGRFFSHEVNLGFVEGSEVLNQSITVWQPRALAALRFIHDFAGAELRYLHDVLPNPLVGNTLVNDSAELRLGFPLGRDTGFRAGAAGSYSYMRAINFASGATDSYTHVAGADATITYRPPRVPELSVFARYQFFQQLGTTDGPLVLPSFMRNVVMVGIAGVYPVDAAAVVPTRQGFRADRTDAASIPNPTSPQQNEPNSQRR